MARSSPSQVVGDEPLGSEVNSSIGASLEDSSAAGKAVPRTVINFIGSDDLTVANAFPTLQLIPLQTSERIETHDGEAYQHKSVLRRYLLLESQ